MLPSRTVINFFSFKSWLPLPRVHWSCPPTFQSIRTSWLSCIRWEYLWLLRKYLPSWTLLTCVAVCKSVQHGTTRSPLDPNSWTKLMPTVGSAKRMLKTFMWRRRAWSSLCFPPSGDHFITLLQIPWTKSRLMRYTFSPHFIQVHQGYLAQKWMQWEESEPQQETKTAWRHLWHQEEQEEVAQTVNSGAKKLATMQQVAEVYLTVVQQMSEELTSCSWKVTASVETDLCKTNWNADRVLSLYLYQIILFLLTHIYYK